MGMDVIGKNTASERGKYFRNSVWWWRPLADYILEVAPEKLTRKCASWHFNDGAGLEGDDARELGRFLHEEIFTGRTAEYEAEHEAARAEIPDEPCNYCNSTGTRSDAVGVAQGMVERKWCNGCDGKGKRRPFRANYPFSVENVAEFADFLVECEGFEIF